MPTTTSPSISHNKLPSLTMAGRWELSTFESRDESRSSVLPVKEFLSSTTIWLMRTSQSDRTVQNPTAQMLLSACCTTISNTTLSLPCLLVSMLTTAADRIKLKLYWLTWLGECWLGSTRKYSLIFMRVSHTRCFVDAGFGLLKQKYRRGDIDTVAQLAQVIKDSASINRAEEFCWLWRSWDSFMRNLFRPVKNITSFQRFSFLSSQPGVVVMSQSDTYQDRHFKILIADPSALQADILPPVVMPAGLSAERAQYLFKEIRPFCHSESQDITCPAPASISDPVVEHDPEEE